MPGSRAVANQFYSSNQSMQEHARRTFEPGGSSWSMRSCGFPMAHVFYPPTLGNTSARSAILFSICLAAVYPSECSFELRGSSSLPEPAKGRIKRTVRSKMKFANRDSEDRHGE